MQGSIRAVLERRSIAVIGATNREGSVGRAIFTNILEGGFQGILYPVNTRARSVMSLRTYPSTRDIPDDLDMAVVIVPAQLVLKVVCETADRGVSGVVVLLLQDLTRLEAKA